jgi:hypothetical protein
LSDLYAPLSTMARNKENKKRSAALKREATKRGEKISAVGHNNSEMLHDALHDPTYDPPTDAESESSIEVSTAHAYSTTTDNERNKMVSLKTSISGTLVDTVILILDQETKGKAWECQHPT